VIFKFYQLKLVFEKIVLRRILSVIFSQELNPAFHCIFWVTAPLRSAATQKDVVPIGAMVEVIPLNI